MALPATSVFEVRASVGNDSNGGGFAAGASGTDFSQQNSPQQAYTDLVAASGTTITSAARPFSSVDVGNFIQIVSGTGWTTGVFQVVSVASNVATMDRTIATGGSTSGVGNLGGALATISKAYSLTIAGNQIWCKATAPYSISSTQTLSGQNPLCITLSGYTTTRGDNGRISWTTATNSINLITASQSWNYRFENINFTSTAGTPGDGFHAGTNLCSLYHLKNCSISGFAYGINGRFSVDWSFSVIFLEDTEIFSCVNDGLANDGQMVLLGCYLHSNGGAGLKMESTGDIGPLYMSHCVVKSNGAAGIDYSQVSAPQVSNYVWPVILNCAIINNTTDGLIIKGTNSAAPGSIAAWNNIFDSNGGYGINMNGNVGIAMVSLRCNAFRNNTSGNYNNLPAGVGDITLTADPFTNRSGGDFTLNSTAGGGTACKAAGFESTILG